MSCFHALTNAEGSGLILLASLQTPPSDPLAVWRPWTGSGGRHSHQVGCLLVHFFRPRFPSKIVQYNVLHFWVCFVFRNHDIISFSFAGQMFSSSAKLPFVFFRISLSQGCISCGILVSRIGARGVSSEHMENMEMFSCSPT